MRVPSSSSPRFTPAATLVIAGALALFFVVSIAYGAWPVLVGGPPPDAGPDYVSELVRQRLAGKIAPLLALCFLVAGLAVARWTRR